MKEIKWIFVLFAVAAASCMIGMGIAIGEESLIGFISCVIALVAVMGFGFSAKAKMRRAGKL
ncbi:YlaF family protein [Bacillus xiapuensis]|uniref:YlaF family protein n=1 Tax=Bacillus xiapuensis TaxID=2014075 RepID=UPI000C24CBEF|nr:YlaF family protein [Bacillus xiapuensis]